MDAILEEQDEDSSGSGITFPSLTYIHAREEEGIGIHLDDTTASFDDVGDFVARSDGGGDPERESGEHLEHSVQHASDHRNNYEYDDDGFPLGRSVQHASDDHKNYECDDDGYPTDERTDESLARSKESEPKRPSVLALARDRLARKTTDDGPRGSDNESTIDSFLADADVADVGSCSADESTFLGDVDVEDVLSKEVIPPDDDFASKRGESVADSYYNVHASTLSRATSASTKPSTIGDLILKESDMAAKMVSASDDNANEANETARGDNQSVGTYSYRRAFGDNVTLGSNLASTLSALTDDYSLEARKTGMSEPVRANGTKGEHSDTGIKRPYFGPVDLDADMGSTVQSSDKSREESMARPPPPSISEADFACEDPGHLTRIISFGGGEGYVDEGMAQRFASDRKGGGRCCGWLASSSRAVKLVVFFSFLLMLASVAGVAFSLLLPEENGVVAETSVVTGGNVLAADRDKKTLGDSIGELDDPDTLVPTLSPTSAPSACVAGAPCSKEGSRCADGTTETCCGETYDSFVCKCVNVEGNVFRNLEYACFRTGACLAPSCEGPGPEASADPPTEASGSTTSAPSESFVYSTSEIRPAPREPAQFPTWVPSPEPTASTISAPSEAPESFANATLGAHPVPQEPTLFSTGAPSLDPTAVPTVRPSAVPTSEPSNRPTPKPSAPPSREPTADPSDAPTDKPTSEPTDLPTEFPTTTTGPTASPTPPPTTPAPTRVQSFTRTVTLRATKGTYVNQAAPDENYSGGRIFWVDASPRLWSLITFDTASIIEDVDRIRGQARPARRDVPTEAQAFRAVTEAKLRLYTLDEGGGCVLLALPNARHWPEAGLTWNNLGQVNRTGQISVGATNWFEKFRWHEMDVTGAFRGGMGSDMSFLMTSFSTDGVGFASQEYDSGAYGPELVLTVYSGPLPAPSPTPESSWPTYFPTRSDPTRPSPSQLSLKLPTKNPFLEQPKRPSGSRTMSPSPAVSTDPGAADNPVDQTSVPPSKSQTGQTSPSFVPPGCPASADISFAFKKAQMPTQSIPNKFFVFPSKDSYIGGGSGSDENHGSSRALILDSYTSRVLIEFDLESVALTSTVHNFAQVSLRLFVETVGETRSISIYKLPQSIEWDEDRVTWENFGTPPIAKVGPTFRVTPSHEGRWIDVDITDLIDGSQANNKLVLIMKDFSATEESGRFVLASRETCRSSKLIMVKV